jgi:hypothetical protein
LHAHAFALPAWYGLTLTLLVCGSAFLVGGRPERLAAGALVLGWVATLLLRDPRWAGPQWGGLAVDAAFFAALVGIALTSSRYWPLFAAAFQLLAVLTHAARILDPSVRGWAYATAGVIWTQLVLVAIGVGVYNRWRERRLAAAA